MLKLGGALAEEGKARCKDDSAVSQGVEVSEKHTSSYGGLPCSLGASPSRLPAVRTWMCFSASRSTTMRSARRMSYAFKPMTELTFSLGMLRDASFTGSDSSSRMSSAWPSLGTPQRCSAPASSLVFASGRLACAVGRGSVTDSCSRPPPHVTAAEHLAPATSGPHSATCQHSYMRRRRSAAAESLARA